MIFRRIRLKNFRQYKKELEFSFSQPTNEGQENITLFIAANGVGKTTLLQAVRYCFYGSSMYLNLPDSKELLNNKLIDDLKELEETSLFVEVEFFHNNTAYIARREKSFKKQNNKMIPIGREGFDLSFLRDPKKGFQEVKDMNKFAPDAAMDKLRAILPEGLSQVFMFDGERMEKNISDKDFSKDLKNSVLGILGITKYDKLIQILGSAGRSSTVLGRLNNKKQANTPEEINSKKIYDELQKKLDEEKTEEKNILIDIDEVIKKINMTKDEQKKYEEVTQLTNDLNILEEQIINNDERIDNLSTKYINKSHKALIYKVLLKNHKKYQDFLSKSSTSSKHYQYLHVKTIEDIQNRGICVCGRPIIEHTDEFDHLELLKKSALPVENAQYLSMVTEQFKKSVDFKVILEELRSIFEEKVKLSSDLKQMQVKKNLIIDEIKKIEGTIGLTKQEEIDEFYKTKSNLEMKLAETKLRIELIQKRIDKESKTIRLIDESNEYNQKVNRVIDTIEEMKTKLMNVKDSRDSIARKTLSKYFDKSLSSVIEGNYEVTIKDDYKISIIEKTLDYNKDVTTVLSTGQNVVVSLSFLNALIKTAKEMSESIDSSEKYGVFMDAALSNLDEKHIERLCRKNLNKMDQLIFLSFKKQLRNEMYQGIKSHIGKAYHLKKDNLHGVVATEINPIDLDNYIHEIEETNDEII